MKKIKIAILIDVLENINGGAEKHVYELIKSIDTNRIEPHHFILHQEKVPAFLEET